MLGQSPSSKVYESHLILSQGGTWFENTYPGVRCDIPGHVYQASFAPRLDWSEELPTGPEVLSYWQGLARHYNVDSLVRLNSAVEHLDWSQEDAKWNLRVRDTVTNVSRNAQSDFVLTAIGRFNEWRMPEYPGTEVYQGTMVHTANWPPTLDVQKKRVAVIGNGSSGIQIIPAIQDAVEHIDHYARSPTWIAPSWTGKDQSIQPDDFAKSYEHLTSSERYLRFRKATEDAYWRRFDSYMRGTDSNRKVRDACTNLLNSQLHNKAELTQHLIPSFSPNCRRLTPGLGYLEAIDSPKVHYIRDKIECLTRTGIRTVDGTERDADVIVCATGFNIDMAPPFPIQAFGRDLSLDWQHEGRHGYPHTYLGMAVPSFPNFMILHGPHGTGLSGLVPHSCENQLIYISKTLRKISREGIRTMTPSTSATDDFQRYSDAFFAETTLSEDCRSWYNGGRAGSKIHGLWPGSAAHATIIRKEPRWEDYDYEYLGSTGNRFWSYFGNGRTAKEGDLDSDMTSYLTEQGSTDIKDLHERWWAYP